MHETLQIMSNRLEIPAREPLQYTDSELLAFINHLNSKMVIGLMTSDSLLFKTTSGLALPTFPSEAQLKEQPDAQQQAFRARVARHTIAVGITHDRILTALETHSYRDAKISHYEAVEAMTLHDLKKIPEIMLRGVFGSSDAAYDAAESHLQNMFTLVNMNPYAIALAGSIGHNGARDFLLAQYSTQEWSLTRQAGYLADELHEETFLQTNVLAKSTRLMSDDKYRESNATGFPECRNHPAFIYQNRDLRKKYDVQQEATMIMAANIADMIRIPWQRLGEYLVNHPGTVETI